MLQACQAAAQFSPGGLMISHSRPYPELGAVTSEPPANNFSYRLAAAPGTDPAVPWRTGRAAPAPRLPHGQASQERCHVARQAAVEHLKELPHRLTGPQRGGLYRIHADQRVSDAPQPGIG